MTIKNEIKRLIESIENLTDTIIESKKIIENKINLNVQETSIKNKSIEKIDPIEEQNKIIKEGDGEQDQIIENQRKIEKQVNIEEKLKIYLEIKKDNIRQLAKQKMAEGVDRSKIKSIITDLAGSDASIADLDESNIEECYNNIVQLKP